ncbi:MAG: citrate synthase [Candidatus Marinamargulisbacteria bacterium]
MEFDHLRNEIIESNTIANQMYDELNVKRGLRNSDGSGVLAGLSRISSVIGVTQSNGSRMPVDGVLKYRGRVIDDLVADTNGLARFEYTVFLLLTGRAPSKDEMHQLQQFLSHHRTLSREFTDHLIRAIPSKNIMNKLQTVVSALYTLDGHPETIDPYENFLKSLMIIAKLPVIVAYAYLLAYETNPSLVTPEPGMNTAQALLYMLRQGQYPTDFETDILDLALLLHAEHGGGNNSSFTTYVVTSSASDIYGTITAALGSLKGPLHGAANKKVMDMMSDIKAHVSNWTDRSEVSAYLEKIVRKEAYDNTGKIYGLGHAVYTKSDPRAVILKNKAKELAEKVNRSDEFQLYCLIEEEGPKAFQAVKGSSKVIAPNVDFFSGFVYDCLNIPVDIYTPLFAMARTAGWCSHRIEEILSGRRVIRPAYKFVG